MKNLKEIYLERTKDHFIGMYKSGIAVNEQTTLPTSSGSAKKKQRISHDKNNTGMETVQTKNNGTIVGTQVSFGQTKFLKSDSCVYSCNVDVLLSHIYK